MANKYLFANLLGFTSGEGDKTTLPPVVKCCAPLEASSMFMEVLIVA